MKHIHFVLGWIFVRPRRWFFWKMSCASFGVRVLPTHDEYFGWKAPNIHWWILYKTLFNFFYWLDTDAWRYFCKWGNVRLTYPLIARVIHKIGKTTVGYAVHGGECFHCGSEEGNPVYLSDDESGKTFVLKETWSVPTPDGTDYCFAGTTICPKCGYESYYQDSSL